jgi:hypothetical protein
MNVIEQVEYTHKWELHTREAHHIKTLNASLNCKIPTQTREEHYQANRERILERAKEYREDNRERILEKHKQYHRDNRERMLERMKQYHQENREARLEYHKQYKLANHEETLEKAKQHYHANRERILAFKSQKIECECGIQVSRAYINKHQRTKKHHKAFYQKTYDFIYS